MRKLAAAAEAGGTTGNAGLGPGASAPLAWRGFRPLVIVASREESADVRSFEFAAEDGLPLPPALPGQYILVRVQPNPDAPAVTRNYSLCGPPGNPNYRIGVKNEHGLASGFLHQSVRAGSRVEVGAPRGSFTLADGCDARRAHQRRCRRHADAGDAACRGRDGRRDASAGLVAAFSPRSGAPFVCQGGGRPARCALGIPSLRGLQSARTGRHARPGLRSARPSLAAVASGYRGSPGCRLLPVWSAPLSRGFPERPGGMGHSPVQDPCGSVWACVQLSRRASPVSRQPCRIVLTVLRAADPW